MLKKGVKCLNFMLLRFFWGIFQQFTYYIYI